METGSPIMSLKVDALPTKASCPLLLGVLSASDTHLGDPISFFLLVPIKNSSLNKILCGGSSAKLEVDEGQLTITSPLLRVSIVSCYKISNADQSFDFAAM